MMPLPLTGKSTSSNAKPSSDLSSRAAQTARDHSRISSTRTRVCDPRRSAWRIPLPVVRVNQDRLRGPSPSARLGMTPATAILTAATHVPESCWLPPPSKREIGMRFDGTARKALPPRNVMNGPRSLPASPPSPPGDSFRFIGNCSRPSPRPRSSRTALSGPRFF